MKKILLRFAQWLLHRLGGTVCSGGHWPALPDALVVRARRLVSEQEGQPSSGESKRHQVYARLLKEFPASLKREAALAIEQAHWGIVLPGDALGQATLSTLRDEIEALRRQVTDATAARREAETVAQEALARATTAQRAALGQTIRDEVESGLSEIHGLRLNELGRSRVSDGAIQGLERAAGVLKRLLAKLEAP